MFSVRIHDCFMILKTSFRDLQTLPGALIFYNFQPLGTIEVKKISNVEELALTFNLKDAFLMSSV